MSTLTQRLRIPVYFDGCGVTNSDRVAAADRIDSLQAQVEVLRNGLSWTLCELYGLKRYMERPEAGEWGVECSVCRNEWFDSDDVAKLDELRAALTQSSDAEMGEKT